MPSLSIVSKAALVSFTIMRKSYWLIILEAPDCVISAQRDEIVLLSSTKNPLETLTENHFLNISICRNNLQAGLSLLSLSNALKSSSILSVACKIVEQIKKPKCTFGLCFCWSSVLESSLTGPFFNLSSIPMIEFWETFGTWSSKCFLSTSDFLNFKYSEKVRQPSSSFFVLNLSNLIPKIWLSL